MPRLGRFLKGGYAPPFGAEWSKAAAERLGLDVLSGSVGDGEAVDRAGDQDGVSGKDGVSGTGDGVVVDRVDQA